MTGKDCELKELNLLGVRQSKEMFGALVYREKEEVAVNMGCSQVFALRHRLESQPDLAAQATAKVHILI